VVANGAEGFEEGLRLARRFETLHPSFPLAGWSVRVLGAVVQPLVAAVLDARQNSPDGWWIAG